MRKVIGIGETILDIIFKGNQPTKANPGGSVFNCLVSLGRLGLKPYFISEVGRDKVGDLILSFMQENHIETYHINRFYDGASPVAMAFLDDNNNAQYQFYTHYPERRLDVVFPKIDADDIVVFGSIYALQPELREKMIELLEYARDRGAIIYYDPNFRSAHAQDTLRYFPTILENIEYADIVRGSDEDFLNIFNLSDSKKIYQQKIAYHCPNFICTHGAKGVDLFTKHVEAHFDVPQLQPVSTIGAGDNFNAGILFGLLAAQVTKSEIGGMSEVKWSKIIETAIEFSSEVCRSYDNYLPKEFAENYLAKKI